jgi:hypothetical protein
VQVEVSSGEVRVAKESLVLAGASGIPEPRVPEARVAMEWKGDS